MSRNVEDSSVSEKPLGQDETPNGRLATGLATAVANHGGGGTVTLNRQELLGKLVAVGRAVEAGQGERALDLIAALVGWVGEGDARVAYADERQ